MARTVNRPFFSLEVLIIAGLVILGGALVSQGLVGFLHQILFR